MRNAFAYSHGQNGPSKGHFHPPLLRNLPLNEGEVCGNSLKSCCFLNIYIYKQVELITEGFFFHDLVCFQHFGSHFLNSNLHF